jgi:hypothetical protein
MWTHSDTDPGVFDSRVEDDNTSGALYQYLGFRNMSKSVSNLCWLGQAARVEIKSNNTIAVRSVSREQTTEASTNEIWMFCHVNPLSNEISLSRQLVQQRRTNSTIGRLLILHC